MSSGPDPRRPDAAEAPRPRGPAAETGKQRASRIPLDYYKKPDRLQRWKGGLAALAGVAALAWWLSGLVRSDGGRPDFSRGPVAGVHTAWNDDCLACHVPFEPIHNQGWNASLLGSAHSGNQRCQACHAGPTHHTGQTPELACASCHRDHRGRDASLLSLADGDCTQCHANLAGHVGAGRAAAFKNVTRFDGDHPQFRAFETKADPGKLKFNHALHMRPGQVLDPKSPPLFTLADIQDPAERELYRQMQPADQRGDTAAVQLDCKSCHRLDSGDFGPRNLLGQAAVLPVRAAGAVMLPIVYDNQCRACHPLTVEKGLTVPHGLQPDQVREFLWGAFANRKIPQVVERPVPSRPLPGQDLDKVRAEIEARVKETEKDLFGEQVRRAESRLFSKQTCGECHVFEDQPRRVVPPQVPQVWYEHARFNHAAHRAMDCRGCHEQAFPDSPRASVKSSDVMLPGIDNCRQCHGPREGAKGGVRHHCTECHSYHNGEHPLQGIGAAARDPLIRRNPEQFLQGLPLAPP